MSDGDLVLAPAPGDPKAGVFVSTTHAWRFDESQVAVHLRQVVSDQKGVNCKFRLEAPDDPWNEGVGFWYERGTVYAFAMTGGSETDFAVFTYSPTADEWLRLRESGSTIYWETSPDGSSWTVRGTAPDSATAMPLDGVRLVFDAQEYSTGNPAPGEARFSGLNAP